MRVRLILGIVVALAASDCADSGQASFCDEEESRCQDDATIEVCQDGRWSAQSCETKCASSGLVRVGCLRRAGNDECQCGPPDESCDEGRVGLCASGGAQWDCGAGIYYHRPCYGLCPGDTPVPAGCYYDLDAGREGCQCVEEGTICVSAAAPQCAGRSEIARCVDDMWWLQDCSDECGTEATCEYDDIHEEGTCRCLAG